MRVWWRRLVRVGVVVVLLGAVLLALGFALGDERTWWIELLRYVPYLVWLLPAGVMLGLTLWLGWRWRVLALLALIVVLTWVMGLSLGLGRAELGADGQGPSLRLMTYNIKAYRAEYSPHGYEPVADEIRRWNPDIIVMQDAHQAYGYVAKGKPPPADLQAALAGRELWVGGQYVVASRYPLSGCGRGDISYPGQHQGYLRCTVQVAGRSVTLVSAHLLSPREGLNATRHERLQGMDDWRENFAYRLNQARKMARDLADAPRPLIVAGDLNAPNDSPVVRSLLDLGLRDAYAVAGRGWGYTIGHALKPHLSFVRIDHILVSPEIGVHSAVTGSRWGSEHRPVIADLVLP